MKAVSQASVHVVDLIMRMRNWFKRRFAYASLGGYCLGKPFVGSSFPSLVGIKTIYRCKRLQRVHSQTLLVNDSVGTNDERLHAGNTVLGRRRSEGNPPIITPFTTKSICPRGAAGPCPFSTLK